MQERSTAASGSVDRLSLKVEGDEGIIAQDRIRNNYREKAETRVLSLPTLHFSLAPFHRF